MPDPTPAVLRNKGVPVELAKLGEDDQPVLDAEGEVVRVTRYLRFTANTCADIEELWAEESYVENLPVYDPDQLAAHTEAKSLWEMMGRDGPEPTLPAPVAIRQLTRTVYGVEAWEQSMQRSGTTTLRLTMALLLGHLLTPANEDQRRVAARKAGAAMLADRMPDYSMAMGVAWAMSQGIDPETAGKMLAAGRKAARDAQTKMQDQALASLTEAVVEASPSGPGTNGSASGAEAPWPRTEVLDAPLPSSGS